MRRPHPRTLLLATLAVAAGLTLGGCRSGDGSDVFSRGADTGTGTGTSAPVSSTVDAAKAEIASNTGETTTPRDTTTVSSREDNPETSTPVAVTF